MQDGKILWECEEHDVGEDVDESQEWGYEDLYEVGEEEGSLKWEKQEGEFLSLF